MNEVRQLGQLPFDEYQRLSDDDLLRRLYAGLSDVKLSDTHRLLISELLNQRNLQRQMRKTASLVMGTWILVIATIIPALVSAFPYFLSSFSAEVTRSQF